MLGTGGITQAPKIMTVSLKATLLGGLDKESAWVIMWHNMYCTVSPFFHSFTRSSCNLWYESGRPNFVARASCLPPDSPCHPRKMCLCRQSRSRPEAKYWEYHAEKEIEVIDHCTKIIQVSNIPRAPSPSFIDNLALRQRDFGTNYASARAHSHPTPSHPIVCCQPHHGSHRTAGGSILRQAMSTVWSFCLILGWH